MPEHTVTVTITVDMGAASNADMEAVDAALGLLQYVPHVSVDGWVQDQPGDQPDEYTECLPCEYGAPGACTCGGEVVRGCSCGMADYGAPGHDGHDETEGGA